MQISRIVAGVALTLATVIAADTALARGGHRHGGTRVVVGVGFGYGFGYPFGYGWGGYGWGYPWGYGYPYPYYYPYYPAYYPAPVVQQQPTVYIEQPQAQPQTQQPQAQQPTGYWYFCPTTQAYYPYVKDCTAGWQRVAPQPAE